MTLFKGGVLRVYPRFHLFVSDANPRRSKMGTRFSFVTAGMERLSFDLTQAVKNS